MAVTLTATERARRVKLMIFDVDGVLTDGRLYFGPGGEALKTFDSLDGHGIKLLASAGLAAAGISLLGYALDLESFQAMLQSPAPGLHTALAVGALAAGTLALRPEVGWVP